MATSEKKSLLTEVPTRDDFQKRAGILTDATPPSNDVRNSALKNAHEALMNAFGPKLDKMIVEKLTSEEGVTEMDLNELIREIENAPEDDDMVKECRQRLDEAKDPSVSTTEKEKMYKDIHRKFWAYAQSLPNKNFTIEPRKLSDAEQAEKSFRENKNVTIQWVSYEGSMIMCSLIAVSDDDSAYVSLLQLPEGDREIIMNRTNFQVTHGFRAKFDQYKNFLCSADNCPVEFTLGNRVASIPPNEAGKGGSDVKIERKGKDIVIGDRIKLEKNRIQNLVNPTDPTNNGANRGSGFVSRPKATGRNAYEIRADVLEMALDWAKTHGDKKLDTDDVLDIAEAFYGFVEHK